MGTAVLGHLFRHRNRPGDPVPRGDPPVDARGLVLAAVALLALLVLQSALVFAVGRGDPERWERFYKGLPLAGKVAFDGGTKLLAAGAAVLLAARGRRAARGRPAPVLRSAAAGLLFAIAMVPVLVAIQYGVSLVHRAAGSEPRHQALVEVARRAGPADFAAIAAFAVVVAPLVEEVFFRRFLYSGLRALLSPLPSALLSAALFSLAHLEGTNFDALPMTFVLGLFLADLRERTGGMAAPVAMHSGYNALQVAAMLWEGRG